MNLELLDPFRKQIPDRIDSTLDLPSTLHFRKSVDPKKKIAKKLTVKESWKAANHVSFNRRGSYIAVGYGSGSVGVFDVLSRTVSGLYRHDAGSTSSPEDSKGGKPKDSGTEDHGVTSMSWSRRSRTLLVGSLGKPEVRLIDTTHPFGPEECCTGIQLDQSKVTDDDNERNQNTNPDVSKESKSSADKTTPFKEKLKKDHFKTPARLATRIIETKEGLSFPATSSAAPARVEFQGSFVVVPLISLSKDSVAAKVTVPALKIIAGRNTTCCRYFKPRAGPLVIVPFWAKTNLSG